MPETVKILIVDDDANTRATICDLVGEYGHNAITAADGKEALDKVHKEKADIVLMDIRLPGLDGYEACRQIKEIEGAKPKVILYTAYVDAVNVTKAREVGADDFIGKTSDFYNVRNAINNLLCGEKMKS